MSKHEPLAIIGVGCRFPGSITNVDSFWNLLIENRSGVIEVPEKRWNNQRFYHPDARIDGKVWTKKAAFIDDIDYFDPAFFGISPREARHMDPQHRWLLEVSWEAMEDAGCVPSSLRGSSTGVFLGISGSDYAQLQYNNFKDIDVHTNSGISLAIASNRISYTFDLKGPSLSVDTACSSSLVAVHLACEKIWSGTCEMALAGGSNSMIIPELAFGFSRASMLSPDGECYTFDSRANGYSRGEGCGMILIKPLSRAIADKNRVYSVIKAAVINQDGNTSSMTIPSSDAQEAMLRQAYTDAGISANRVVYMEAHGTGTPVGDPIEVEALGRVLSEGREKEDSCIIGSIKTNIGHLEPASGIAGLIKGSLVLHHGLIPANRNFLEPNPNVPLEKYHFKVATENQPLPHKEDALPAVGVNSFGFGGTNAHVVLEQAPAVVGISEATIPDYAVDRPYLLPISARHENSLKAYVEKYRDTIRDQTDTLSDICSAAGEYKEQHPMRLVFQGKDECEMLANIDAWLVGNSSDEQCVSATIAGQRNELIFVFSGQGSQWWGMGQQLLGEEPVFRTTVQTIDEQFQRLSGWSILDEMTRSKELSKVDETYIAQPLIFALQVAMAELWKSFGIVPDKVIGHSVGEVAAAYCAGIYTLEDAVKVIYHRSRLQNTTGGQGKMIAVGSTVEEAQTILANYQGKVALAVVNSPSLVTLAGDTEPLIEVTESLRKQGVFVKELPIDYAFHTHQMDPIKAELLSALSDLSPKSGSIPCVSTVTEAVINGTTMDGHYWWRNVREPVMFGSSIIKLLSEDPAIDFLEIGPHASMRSALKECNATVENPGTYFHSVARENDDLTTLLNNLSHLHNAQHPIDWKAVNRGSGKHCSLPVYPWFRQSYWLESSENAEQRLSPVPHPFLQNRIRGAQPTWQFTLDPKLFDYLYDHQVWGSMIFPASGFCEMGLALSKLLFPGEHYVVESVELKRALFIAENNIPVVQIVFDASNKSFSVYSSDYEKENWELHATGCLHKLPKSEPLKIDLEALKTTLPQQQDHQLYYDALKELGLPFGKSFRHVQAIWKRSGESLVHIVSPQNVVDTASDYSVHPAVIDAFFHGTKAAEFLKSEEEPKCVLQLPASVKRVEILTDEIPQSFWCHTRLTLDAEGREIANINLYDETGRRFALVLGFRTDLAETRASNENDYSKNFYELVWKPRRLAGTGYEGDCCLPTSKTIANRMGAEYETLNTKRGNQERIPRLDDIGRICFLNALMSLSPLFKYGYSFSIETLFTDLGMDSKYKRFVRFQISSLAQEGYFKKSGNDRWTVSQPIAIEDVDAKFRQFKSDLPDFAADIALCETVFPFLADVLKGEINPVELLFGEKTALTLNRFYCDAGNFKALNHATAQGFSEISKTLPKRRALRVLEIGAGVGSLTEAILKVLPVESTEYTFTDISPTFIAEAKAKFADYSFIEYKLFNLNTELAEQNIPAHQYDVVVASNVLHATESIKETLQRIQQCLVPGGMLIFIDTLNTHFSINNIFGLFPEWWNSANDPDRGACSLLTCAEWSDLLEKYNFSKPEHILDSTSSDGAYQGIFVTRSQLKESPVETNIEDLKIEDNERSNYILFQGERDLEIPALAEKIRANADRAVIVRNGKQLKAANDDYWELDILDATTLDAFFKAPEIAEHKWTGIISGLSLNLPDAEKLDLQLLEDAQQSGCLHGFHLAQVLQKNEALENTRVFFISRDCFKVVDNDCVGGLSSRPLVGLIRAANNEMYNHFWTLIDLEKPAEGQADPEEINDIYCELNRNHNDHEVAFRQGIRYTNEILRMQSGKINFRSKNAIRGVGNSVLPYRLETSKAGVLENLSLHETQKIPLKPHEIQVQVKAGGVNFRDVMKALAIYPGNPIDLEWYGDDFSGVIVDIGPEVTDLSQGDEVVGLAPYAFKSYVNVDARMVSRKPPTLSFLEAATMPTIFLTAHYALCHLARMERGEKVLIHAGSGGVGQAAIQVAKRLGLEIFATAGTPEKRQMLHEQGVDLVMDSRSLKFADDIMTYTQGYGVDAVLNSLAGDFIPKSLSVLAPFGRFLEIGKIDVYNNSKLGLEGLKNNIAYYVIDLAQHLEKKPNFASKLFKEVSELAENGDYKPIVHTVYPVTEAVDAFRFIAQGKHIGKVILNFDLPEIPVRLPIIDGVRFSAEASYLVTGGSGGFGLAVAHWMATQGAGHIGLMSRSGPRSDEDKTVIDTIRAMGVKVYDLRGDVSLMSDVSRVVEDLQTQSLPIKGIVHSAMVLGDEFMTYMDDECFQKVLKPKVHGSWNLHQISLSLELDHYIAFSSLSSITGPTKQANYTAANCFIDGLSEYRRKRGLPMQVYNWGPIGGTGFLARNTKTAEYVDKIGLKLMDASEALDVINHMLALDTAQIISAHIDWKSLSRLSSYIGNAQTYKHILSEGEQAQSGGSLRTMVLAAPPEQRIVLLTDFISEQVAQVLGTEPSMIDRETAITNMGLDSLMAVELISRIEDELRLNFPMGKILNGPNLNQMAQTMFDLLEVVVPDGKDAEVKQENHAQQSNQSVLISGTTHEHNDAPATINSYIKLDSIDYTIPDSFPQLDAVAINYFHDYNFAFVGLTREQMWQDESERKATFSSVHNLSEGTIGMIRLPYMEEEILTKPAALEKHFLDAIKLAGLMGAKCVALTGVLTAATQQGQQTKTWLEGTSNVPLITTGEAARAANVVKSIEGILFDSKRCMSKENLMWIGINPISVGALRLTLLRLKHPQKIVLCAQYQKLEAFDRVEALLRADGYDGTIEKKHSIEELPDSAYSNSMIVAITSWPHAISIDKVKKGTLIVDYSFPHSFDLRQAIQRLEHNQDILFTTGAKLKLSQPIIETIFLPKENVSLLRDATIKKLEQLPEMEQNEIEGCVLISLLTAQNELIIPTLGEWDISEAIKCYDIFNASGISPARLQLGDYVISSTLIEQFVAITR